ncbi:MAG: DUF3368 domain-containing protein [Defluviitaleaceae bacterium]|nr:DUF3368 domain-containing protein [Defluviitaleaceae bacterium]MCL2836644.1 DUF3368 domain-containing protein [Defluviitaleaceae bacterium]
MGSPIIVANSTPLILLEKIGRLDLLKHLYGEIAIPEAVYKEVILDYPANDKDFITDYTWIDIIKIQNNQAKILFATSLHEGEVETMMLAMELSADLCILDDLLARKYARNIGLNITGTLGILLAAKGKGFITDVKPEIDKLIQIGMYISSDLYTSILSSAKGNSN